MSLDLFAGLGAGNQLVASKYSYDFATMGGAVGDLALAGDAMPAGILVVGAIVATRTMLTSGGAAILADSILGRSTSARLALDELTRDMELGQGDAPFLVDVQTVPLLSITVAPLTAGAFDLWVLYVK